MEMLIHNKEYLRREVEVENGIMENLYRKIANKLNNIIPEKWDKIFLYSEITQWDNRTYFYYYTKEGNKLIYSLDIEDIYDIDEDELEDEMDCLEKYLEELWIAFKENKQQQWTNLTLYLSSDGEFEIEYDYTDLNNSDGYEQQVIWKYEKLGIYPAKDRTRDINIIKKYKRSK